MPVKDAPRSGGRAAAPLPPARTAPSRTAPASPNRKKDAPPDDPTADAAVEVEAALEVLDGREAALILAAKRAFALSLQHRENHQDQLKIQEMKESPQLLMIKSEN